MNTKWLETFRRVAELKSFTRAAETLELTQPAVSQQVRHLERIFGEKLFSPAGRAIQVTEAGQLIYAAAARIEAEMARLRDQLRTLSTNGETMVRIASGPTALSHFLPRLLKRFWAEYPDISVRTHTIAGQPMTDAVQAGWADLAFQTAAHLDPTLVATPAIDDHVILVCSPDHPLAAIEYLTAADLREIKIGFLPVRTESRRMIEDWLATEGVTLQHAMQFGANETIRASVLANVIAGFVSEYAVLDDIALGRLRRLNVRGLSIRRPLYALHRPNPSQAVSRMVDLIQRSYNDPSFWA